MKTSWRKGCGQWSRAHRQRRRYARTVGHLVWCLSQRLSHFSGFYCHRTPSVFVRPNVRRWMLSRSMLNCRGSACAAPRYTRFFEHMPQSGTRVTSTLDFTHTKTETSSTSVTSFKRPSFFFKDERERTKQLFMALVSSLWLKET